jgi:hypothetical protein
MKEARFVSEAPAVFWRGSTVFAARLRRLDLLVWVGGGITAVDGGSGVGKLLTGSGNGNGSLTMIAVSSFLEHPELTLCDWLRRSWSTNLFQVALDTSYSHRAPQHIP